MCVQSTPNRLQDWRHLQSALEAERIHTRGPISDLGGCEFWVTRKNAAHARPVVERTIRDDKLTVRVTKDMDPQIYEVYENGEKVREESYSVK